MKKVIFSLFAGFCFYGAAAQVAVDTINTDPDGKIFTYTEIKPSYPGGEQKFIEYFAKNLNKELLLKNGAVPGIYAVTIRMIISQNGFAYDMTPMTKCGYGVEEEAIRILRTINRWEPAKQNYRIVRSYFIKNINVELRNQE